MNKLWILPILAIVVAGCHSSAQIPPTSHTATLTVTNSPCAAGTPASTCGYVFSRAVVTGSSCPGTGTPGTYTPLNQGSPTPQPATGNASYVDASAAGDTVCYIAQTVQGTAASASSAAVGPSAVPANPTAPSIGTPAIAQDDRPAAPLATDLALNAPAVKVVVR